MNFFEYQDRARRNSGLLVGLFTLAVALLVGLTTLATAAAVSLSRGQAFSLADIEQVLGWQTILGIALTIAAIVVLGSLHKLRQLSAGGSAVAESLGGRKLNIAPQNACERRALNVVEEMAIASGTPVPDVYLIEEDAINAFAAGYHPTDAVIGLTRGCIEKLNRDELQGVVAHEFSHILNGDMRLNIRIVGLLNGILVIGLLGFWLVRGIYSSSRGNRGRAVLAGFGATLMVAGYTGTFLGNLIKSALSRQREFLADASAVQFTRDNSGLASALKKIGRSSAGSALSNGKAAEYSHLFFASGMKPSLFTLFATHPPLVDRILRLDPDWNGLYTNSSTGSAALSSLTPTPNPAQRSGNVQSAPFQVTLEAVNNSIANPNQQQVQFGQRLLQTIPASIQQAAHDPFAARALVYLLLLHKDADEQQAQRQLLKKIAHPAVVREIQQLEPQLQPLPNTVRLALLDLCVPALRALVPQQYQIFKRNLIKLLHSDGKIEVWEWALYRVLVHALEDTPDLQRRSRKKGASQDAARFLLAAIAHSGNNQYLPAKRAYEQGLKAMALEVTPLPSKKDINLPRLDKAIAIAGQMNPLEKPTLLKAMVCTLNHNGVVKAEEIELLRAVADSLDCPIPPLLSSNLEKASSR
ncbi:M48 family metallopeptidase [Microbulbifer sp. 2205BS26-8]|uniref:M48 family metallopeptidase n=1 Tax=Microbulbifer sp. 2205BS26-8 TaxID=3064386 RepID=UPI00273DDAC1|nr:M48 family metallopeptidase [Microbulbifer sp. 2205BS26-8]MDP5209513.1 M48 family metallopeptidase [Microbulbifer sp. 2205BS26-8]